MNNPSKFVRTFNSKFLREINKNQVKKKSNNFHITPSRRSTGISTILNSVSQSNKKPININQNNSINSFEARKQLFGTVCYTEIK